jgi:hypothetical protein
VNSFGQNRASLEGRKIPGGVAQPGERQEILGKLSIPCVALLSLYSPKCGEGEFCEVRLCSKKSSESSSDQAPYLLYDGLRGRYLVEHSIGSRL